MSCGNKRGRPPGSSWKNATDYPILTRVADQIIINPTLMPTTAMRLTGVTDPNDQKRLRSKWKGVSEQYLLDARQRREAAAMEAMRAGFQQIGLVVGQALLGVNATVQQVRAYYAKWAEENRDVAEGIQAAAAHLRAHQVRLASQPRISR